MLVSDLRANLDPSDLQSLDGMIAKATRRITDRQQSELASAMARKPKDTPCRYRSAAFPSVVLTAIR